MLACLQPALRSLTDSWTALHDWWSINIFINIFMELISLLEELLLEITRFLFTVLANILTFWQAHLATAEIPYNMVFTSKKTVHGFFCMSRTLVWNHQYRNCELFTGKHCSMQAQKRCHCFFFGSGRLVGATRFTALCYKCSFDSYLHLIIQ